MAGAAGALLCVAAGLSVGMAVRERWSARRQMLAQTQDMLTRLRLMLNEERMGLCELLEEAAAGLDGGMPDRFRQVAAMVRKEPLFSLQDAYLQAEKQRIPGEMAPEGAVLRQLFGEIAVGTAAMREQAVAACLRRLKPISDEAEHRAALGSKLCIQLGMLAGVMVGILLW